MVKPKRKLKEGFVISAAIAGAIVLFLILGWWLKHAVIGWCIFGVIIVGFVFVLVRYPRFRNWVLVKGRTAGENLIFENPVYDREAVPLEKYSELMSRAGTHCQNPDCTYPGKPHVHHIDQDSRNNNLSNLIALCPNCHKDAHDGKYSFSQLRNWTRLKSPHIQPSV